MRAAMAQAAVGDEQKREDPTVIELERRIADLFHQDDAVFVPSVTMANQIALAVLTVPGDELIAEENSHILINELGGPAFHSRIMVRGLSGDDGRLMPDQIRAALGGRRGFFHPVTRVVCIENTHNAACGRVWDRGDVAAIAAVCGELNLALHVDGARLFNAAVATGVAPGALVQGCSTIAICLSKGLGCPVGGLIAGAGDIMVAARRAKHLFGGAMRQAGVLAAAGLYALDHHIDRLADDHARARRLAEGLATAGLAVPLEKVETNFVHLNVAEAGLTKDEALARLELQRVKLSSTIHDGILRAVTHLDVSDEQITYALEAIPSALLDDGSDLHSARGTRLVPTAPASPSLLDSDSQPAHNANGCSRQFHM
jgi:threonine aldolase